MEHTGVGGAAFQDTAFSIIILIVWTFPVAQTVKNQVRYLVLLSAMQETQVRYLGWIDSLEKGIATHSSILVWRIPWTEEPGRLQSVGLRRVRHRTEQLTLSLSYFPS